MRVLASLRQEPTNRGRDASQANGLYERGGGLLLAAQLLLRGPRTPSPAARLLPGPGYGRGSEERSRVSRGTRQAGGGCTPITCRRQSARWRRPELRNHATPPHLPEGPRPAGPKPHRQQDQPTGAILDSTDVTSLPSTERRRQGQSRMWRNSLNFLFLLVSLCPASRVCLGFLPEPFFSPGLASKQFPW